MIAFGSEVCSSSVVTAVGTGPSAARSRLPSSLALTAATVSAFALLSSCDPGTTRPDVLPFPDSRQIEVILDRPGAITALRDALIADSFPISRFDARDAWLESPWMDRRTLRPVAAGRLGPDVVRLRAWADPARPGNSFVTVELAWRPAGDPSVPPRELERPVAASDSIVGRVGAVLDQVASEIGFHGPPANGGGAGAKAPVRGRP